MGQTIVNSPYCVCIFLYILGCESLELLAISKLLLKTAVILRTGVTLTRCSINMYEQINDGPLISHSEQSDTSLYLALGSQHPSGLLTEKTGLRLDPTFLNDD